MLSAVLGVLGNTLRHAEAKVIKHDSGSRGHSARTLFRRVLCLVKHCSISVLGRDKYGHTSELWGFSGRRTILCLENQLHTEVELGVDIE